MINQDTNNPNFDWIGMTLKYTPDGYTTPQYGIEVGGYNISVHVYLQWWFTEGHPLPTTWWYVIIDGDFYLDLLWNGGWIYNVQDM